MIVKTWLQPLDMGMVTRSACMWANLFWGNSNSPMGGFVWRVILDLWQGTHSLAHLDTSWFMLGHTNFALIASLVLCTPGWPSPWITSNILLRHADGTKGRAGPLEMSTNKFWFPTFTFLKRSPVVASRDILMKSWSRGWSTAMASKSTW